MRQNQAIFCQLILQSPSPNHLVAEGSVMRTRLSDAIRVARSRVAFWLVITALLIGLLSWFIVMNRSRVSVFLPFGFGTWVSPLSLVIFASFGLGSLCTLALQAFLATRRQLRKIYRRWQSPKTHHAHRAEMPHIVASRPRPAGPLMLNQEKSDG